MHRNPGIYRWKNLLPQNFLFTQLSDEKLVDTKLANKHIWLYKHHEELLNEATKEFSHSPSMKFHMQHQGTFICSNKELSPSLVFIDSSGSTSSDSKFS